MKVCAIIAEFNPFHNGHAYLIEKVRSLGFTHVIIVMSGNFVQRGEPSIISKDIRAITALKNGANLVIEIPTIKSILSAEKFAFAGISLIASLGSVDGIAFGMESENLENLINIEKTLKDDNFSRLLKIHLSRGITFAKAREEALNEIIGEKISCELHGSNNILAVEYLKAIDNIESSVEVLGVRRLENPSIYLSASKIRNLINLNNISYKKYIPLSSFSLIKDKIFKREAPASIYTLSSQKAIISRLRGLSLKEISSLPDISEGIENRIFKAIRNSTSIPELFFNIKTKRYTLSRIRRIILCAFLGIKSYETEKPLNYIKILGMDNKGKDLLKYIKKNSKLPIITKYKDILSSGKNAVEAFEKENDFNNLYGLLTPKILKCEQDKSFKLIKE